MNNASNSARPTSVHAPRYKKFDQLVYTLREMQRDDAFVVQYQAYPDNKEDLIFQFNQDFHPTPKQLSILSSAGVEYYQHKIIFSNYLAPHKTYIVTRSVSGILNYLSKGVEVPPEDYQAKLATKTYANGKVFDWQRVLHGIIHIHSGAPKPPFEVVSIQYLGHWFYIDNRESNSKQTLILLTDIIGLISLAAPPSPIKITRTA